MKWQSINRGSWIDGILWFGEAHASPGLAVEVARRPCFGASVTLGGESTDVRLHLGAGLLSVHLALEGVFPTSWRHRASAWAERRAAALNAWRVTQPAESSPVYAYHLDPFAGRSTGFDLYDGTLLLRLWNSDGGWDHRDRSVAPWDGNGWTWAVPLVDTLIGPMTYEAEIGTTHANDVVMPEGRYPATVRIYRARQNRRWWRGAWFWRFEVDVPGGVPLPGKGENSWDCDDDAVYGMTVSSDGYPHVFDWWACQQLAMSVLTDRQRRGGLDWVPDGGWPPHLRPPGAPGREVA